MLTFKAKLKLNKTQSQQVTQTLLGCVDLFNEVLGLCLEQGEDQWRVPSYEPMSMAYSLVDVPAAIAQQTIRRVTQAVKPNTYSVGQLGLCVKGCVRGG